MSVKIAVRLGRQVVLNGTDEFLHKANGDIAPSNAFDLGTSAQVTFGALVRVGYAALDKRMAIMAKRESEDLDPGTAQPGWILERTEENTVRLFLDDGTNDTSLTTSTDPDDHQLLDDGTLTSELATPRAGEAGGFFRTVIVTIDRVAGTASLWMNRSPDTRIMTKVIDAQDISTVTGDLTNAHNFAVGAVYDGTTDAIHWEGGIAWVAWWNEILPDRLIEVLGRIQFPPPDDRRIVSIYPFTERNADDWHPDNQNDLVEVGIGETNYAEGPDRYVVRDSIGVTPGMGGTATTGEMRFHRFRPHPLQEGHFYQVGAFGAPPLRLRRTIKGAADPPIWSVGTPGHCTIYGKYASMFNREGGGADVWRLYEVDIDEHSEAADPIPEWEPIGKLTDSDYRNSVPKWAADRRGIPSFLYGVAARDTLENSLFLVTDIRDPTSPTKHGTLDVGADNPDQLILDARDNDRVWYKADNGKLVSIDVSTPSAPAQDGTVTDPLLDSGATTPLCQIGNRIYTIGPQGLAVADITDPANPSATSQTQTDPDGVDDDEMREICLAPSLRYIYTFGIDNLTGTSNGVMHIWDLADPDAPVLLSRIVDPALDGPGWAYNQGTRIWVGRSLSATPHLVLINAAQPASPTIHATYRLDTYDRDFQGVDLFLDIDRDTIAAHHHGGEQFCLFKTDDAYGRVALTADLPASGAVIENLQPPWEHEKLFHDLGDWDFETDSPGAGTPTGWTKVSGGSSTAETSDERGLTGQAPASTTPPQSCKLELGGGDTIVGISASMTPATADMKPGTIYPLTLWYRVEGNGTFDPATDLEFRVEESGGVSAEDTTEFAEHGERHRWHRHQLDFPLGREDSTTLEVRIRLLNATNIRVYLDTIRFGPATLPPLFAGRLLGVEGSGEEADGRARLYAADFIDHAFDLNRLEVTDDIPAGSGGATIRQLVVDFARSKDRFNTDNVSDELGSHQAIATEGDENLKIGGAIERILKQTGGQFWLRGRQLFAQPPGFSAAPMPVNDVIFDWAKLTDLEDGAEIATQGTVPTDQSRSTRTGVDWDDTVMRRRYGEIHFTPDPSEDTATAGQAGDVRDHFRQLLAHTQLEGSFEVYNDPRWRPGQIVPIQIDVRFLDIRAQVKDVNYSIGSGGKLVATVTYALLKQDVFDLLLPEQADSASQRDDRQYVEDHRTAAAWSF